MLKKDDPAQQMVYYQVYRRFHSVDIPLTIAQLQAGIGTYNTTQIATPSGAKLSKTIDMMVGKHLDGHVMGRRPPKSSFTRWLTYARSRSCRWLQIYNAELHVLLFFA